MKSINKTILIASAIAAIILVHDTQAQAGSLYILSSFEGQKQNQSNWCWAATMKVLLRWFGSNQTQCSVVKKGLAKSTCPNQTGNVHINKRAFDYYKPSGTSLSSYYSAMSWSSLKSEIQAWDPFAIRIGWKSGGGHYMSGYGYVDNDGSSNDYVYYYNPASGGSYECKKYSYLKSNSSWTWTHHQRTSG